MKNNEIKNIVELYIGEKVNQIDVVQDPNNSNYFALRVNFGKNDVRNYIYFIIQQSNGKCDRDSLEEVEFESWPPTFDKKNMFKLENMNVMLS